LQSVFLSFWVIALWSSWLASAQSLAPAPPAKNPPPHPGVFGNLMLWRSQLMLWLSHLLFSATRLAKHGSKKVVHYFPAHFCLVKTPPQLPYGTTLFFSDGSHWIPFGSLLNLITGPAVRKYAWLLSNYKFLTPKKASDFPQSGTPWLQINF